MWRDGYNYNVSGGMVTTTMYVEGWLQLQCKWRDGYNHNVSGGWLQPQCKWRDGNNYNVSGGMVTTTM